MEKRSTPKIGGQRSPVQVPRGLVGSVERIDVEATLEREERSAIDHWIDDLEDQLRTIDAMPPEWGEADGEWRRRVVARLEECRRWRAEVELAERYRRETVRLMVLEQKDERRRAVRRFGRRLRTTRAPRRVDARRFGARARGPTASASDAEPPAPADELETDDQAPQRCLEGSSAPEERAALERVSAPAEHDEADARERELVSVEVRPRGAGSGA